MASLFTWKTKNDLYSILNSDVFKNFDEDPLNNPSFLKFVAAYYLDDNLETKQYYIMIINDFFRRNTKLFDAYDNYTESKMFKILTDFVMFLSEHNHPLYIDLLQYLSSRINRSNIV